MIVNSEKELKGYIVDTVRDLVNAGSLDAALWYLERIVKPSVDIVLKNDNRSIAAKVYIEAAIYSVKSAILQKDSVIIALQKCDGIGL